MGRLASETTDRRLSASTEEVIGRVRTRRAATSTARWPRGARRSTAGPFRADPEQRGDAIRRLSDALKKRGPAIAEVVSRQNGCPAREAIGTQVFAATMVLDLHADMAKTFEWESERVGAFGNPLRVRRLRSASARRSRPGTCRCSSWR